VLVIDVPLTLRGDDPENPAIIVVVQNDTMAGRETDGVVNSEAVDIVFENLVFIPSLAFWPTDDGLNISPVDDITPFSFTMSNCVITANDGNDQPVTMDGMTYEEEALLSGISYQDDGLFILGGFSGLPNGPMDVLIEDSVISHISFEPPIDVGSSQDAFILGGNNITATIRNTVVSFSERFGFQILQGVTVNLEGTAEEPIISMGHGSSGILAFQGNHTWSYVQLLDNPLGTRIDLDTTEAHDINNLLVTNATDAAVGYFFSPPEGVTRNFSISDSTFFNCAENIAFRLGAATTGDTFNLDVRDSVFAGLDGDDLFFNTDVEEGTAPDAVFNLSNSAVVTEGGLAVDPGPFIDAVNQTGVINSDPMFASTDPASESFLSVTAPAYATAGSDDSALGGYFPFGGDTQVHAWSLY